MKKINLLLLIVTALFFAQSCVDESGEYVRQLFTDGQKEAAFTACLTTSSDSAMAHLCVPNGYSQYQEGAYMIDFNPLQTSVFQTLIDNNYGYLVDSMILLSNRVAENCSPTIMRPIFKEAISNLKFYDHDNLINGGTDVITNYFIRFKDADMKSAMQSPVSIRMNLLGVNDCWNQIVAQYYQFEGQPVSFDVQNYLIEKMLDGLYEEMRVEELNIRSDYSHCESADSLLFGAGF